MSIIYEALQTMSPDNDVQSLVISQNNMTFDDWVDVTIALIIAVLLAVLIVAHYPRFSHIKMTVAKPNTIVLKTPNVNIMSETTKSPSQTSAKPVTKKESFENAEYKSKHILNGVFVSEEEKVAMINNRFFHIGDRVDGMKIINIELDKIKLQNEYNILELKTVV